MFTAKDIIPDSLLSDIKSKVSDYDIFKFYCRNFEEINKPFLSEFYADNNPSCRVYQNKDNALYYKDFGTGDNFGSYWYVMHKFNCTFKEALTIIANDFGLFKSDKVRPEVVLGRDSVFKPKNIKVKSTISIVPRQWNLHDYNYWFKQYGISFDWLDSYEVIPCEYIYLHKGDKTIVFQHKNDNPIYAYRFTHEGKYSYKVYFPLSPNKKFKWMFSGGTENNIEGYYQLPLIDDLLIITKSLKDCICYRILGYSAISLQGEANKLKKDLVVKLQRRFKQIIVNYDNDEQGIKSAHKITSNYGFRSIFIPSEYKCKDLSDLIQLKGLNEAETVIKNLLNETTKKR